MEIVQEGVAVIIHSETKVAYEIPADELDFEARGGEKEGGMGPDVMYSASYSHPELGELSWWIREYPTGGYDSQGYDIGAHTMARNLTLTLRHTPED